MAISLRNLLAQVVVIFGITTVASTDVAIQPRMMNGAVVDTLRRFPHHVTIEPLYNGWGEPTLCGGSILDKNWIVTSALCVKESSRLNLHIQRLHRNDTSGSFTVVVNNDPSNVILYPTGFDDIALVKLPVNLIFSNTIKPIPILETSLDQQRNKLAVLPGFDFSTVDPTIASTPATYSYNSPLEDSLTYAMLRIVSNNECSSVYIAGGFDEYMNVCAKGWGNNRNAPCLTDHGNGLVVDWPANPKLLGIYASSSNDCNSRTPSVYINIQKYKSWIDSVILNN